MPVAAICHGVLLAARSRTADGRSVLFGRRTTALTWALERKPAGRSAASSASGIPTTTAPTRTRPARPQGYMSVQQEVTPRAGAPRGFPRCSARCAHYRRKTGGMARDTVDDDRAAFVVRDGNYVSARWPGDAHTFAKTFAAVLSARAA